MYTVSHGQGFPRPHFHVVHPCRVCAALGWEFGLPSLAGGGCGFLPDRREGWLGVQSLLCPCLSLQCPCLSVQSPVSQQSLPVPAVPSVTAVPAELVAGAGGAALSPGTARGAGAVSAMPMAPRSRGCSHLYAGQAAFE